MVEHLKWLKVPEVREAWLEVPERLEKALCRMCRREEMAGFEPVADGIIGGPLVPAQLAAAPRWSYGVLLPISGLPPARQDDAPDPRALDPKPLDLRALDWPALFGDIRQVLDNNFEASTSHQVRYRINVTGRKLDAAALAALLNTLRSASQKYRLIDDPSDYAFELAIRCKDTRVHIAIKPMCSVAGRFDYRVADVGASINPVLAACAARMIPASLTGTVVDPTCGSGTMLFERSLYASADRMIGMDISGVAIKAAERNLKAFRGAANKSANISFVQGDATDAALWPPCDVVLANLPYGLRVRLSGEDLLALYQGVLQRAAEVLSEEGRILMIATNARVMDQAIAKVPRLRVRDRQRALSGGLYLNIFVLSKGGHQGV